MALGATGLVGYLVFLASTSSASKEAQPEDRSLLSWDQCRWGWYQLANWRRYGWTMLDAGPRKVFVIENF